MFLFKRNFGVLRHLLYSLLNIIIVQLRSWNRLESKLYKSLQKTKWLIIDCGIFYSNRIIVVGDQSRVVMPEKKCRDLQKVFIFSFFAKCVFSIFFFKDCFVCMCVSEKGKDSLPTCVLQTEFKCNYDINTNSYSLILFVMLSPLFCILITSGSHFR